MKAATIVPQQYLHMTKDNKYHMALAHMIGEPGFGKYTDFYRQMATDPKKYVIMDNGEFEGEQQPLYKILDKAYSIHANEIILPDSFGNCDETIIRTLEAYNYIKDNCGTLVEKYGYIPKLMIVPQGKNIKEWLKCAEALLALNIHTIGIPKILGKYGGICGRLEVLRALGHKLRGVQIHLLGCWDSPIEIQLINTAINNGDILHVRSVDSALPYVYARNNETITSGPRSNDPVDFKDIETDPAMLEWNIDYWQKFVAEKYKELPYI